MAISDLFLRPQYQQCQKEWKLVEFCELAGMLPLADPSYPERRIEAQ